MKDLTVPGADAPEEEPKPSLEELQERSQVQRAALTQTAQELEQRLTQTANTVREAVDGTQDMLQQADETVKTYRWAFVAGAVAFGAVVGSRKKRHHEPPPITIPPKRSITGSLLSMAVGVAAKQLGTAVATKILEQGQAAPVDGNITALRSVPPLEED